jgi:hypothetical protein
MDQELKQYLDGKFSEMGAKFATKLDLERVETRLLTEFHKWASPAEARAKTHTAAIRAIDLERIEPFRRAGDAARPAGGDAAKRAPGGRTG